MGKPGLGAAGLRNGCAPTTKVAPCCAADGKNLWAAHEDKVGAFRSAALADVKGDLFWLVQQAVVNGAALLESTYRHTQPFFIATRCQGQTDMAALLEALSHDCAYDPASGTLRSCRYYRDPVSP